MAQYNEGDVIYFTNRSFPTDMSGPRLTEYPDGWVILLESYPWRGTVHHRVRYIDPVLDAVNGAEFGAWTEELPGGVS